MKTYLLRRVLSMAAVLLVVGTVAFFILYLAPGDPASLVLGDQATLEEIAQLRHQMGLDLPLPYRLSLWFWRLVQGDLGRSIYYQTSVLGLILSRLEPSALLSVLGTMLAVVLGVPLGVAAATRRGRVADRLIVAGSVLGMSIPSFWLSLNLILLFSIHLRWAPVSGYVLMAEDPWGALRSLVLPAVSVGVAQAAWLARITRSAMLEVLEQDFVRTARSKGLAERVVVYAHALRNGILPVITVISIVGLTLFSAAIVIEVVFAIPGIGLLVTDSVLKRDYPTIQGTIIFVGVGYAFVNLAVDLFYVLLDPRVRYE